MEPTDQQKLRLIRNLIFMHFGVEYSSHLDEVAAVRKVCEDLGKRMRNEFLSLGVVGFPVETGEGCNATMLDAVEPNK